MANTDKGGWVKIPRSILDSWVARDALAFTIYMHIRLRARWDDGTVIENGIEIGRGQVFICQRKLAALLAAPEHAVRSRIRRMTVAGMFAKETFENGVVITVPEEVEAKTVAGRVAPSSQKRRTSVAGKGIPSYLYKKSNKEKRRENDTAAPPGRGDGDAGHEGDGWFDGKEV